MVHCATPDGHHSGLVMFMRPTCDSTVMYLDDIKDITLPECLVPADSLPRKTPQSGYSLLPASSDMPSCMWPISLTARDSRVIVFAVDSQEDQQQWYNWLKVFKHYPYSPVPCEPTLHPAKNLPRCKLNPAKFNAGLCTNIWIIDQIIEPYLRFSVFSSLLMMQLLSHPLFSLCWISCSTDSVQYVCVLPVEVGTRVSTSGINLLALSGQISQDHVGQLKIFSAKGECPLVILWDRSTIVEGGRLGDLAFVQIGEQGAGGPGLLWLCAGADEAASLYRTLCR